MMIKPKRLKVGDKVAIVSPSSGILGDKPFLYMYALGKKRLEELFGLEVVAMPNALKGSDYLYDHPEKRAEDLMEAFSDSSIKAIITAIGGDDGVRLLPYIDYQVIHDNPKIFTGFSDTTVNNLMLWKAGLVSFYGPALMSDFAQAGGMFDYTVDAIRQLWFEANPHFEIKKSSYWIKFNVDWDERDENKKPTRWRDEKGYEVIQGSGVVKGVLLGGCLDAFPLYNGTSVWPAPEEWQDKLLFMDTSNDFPTPDLVSYYLRNLGAQGVFDKARGLIFGKPVDDKYYDEYKKVFRQILKEFHREDLPVLYNVNFGHCDPRGIIPYGIECELDADNKTLTLLEAVVE